MIYELQTIIIHNQSEYGRSCLLKLGRCITLMCPVCYKLYNVNQRGSIFSFTDKDIDLLPFITYHIWCADCGNSVNAIVVDMPIAEAISKLNRLGYTTEQCCSGHSDDKINNAMIKFTKEYDFCVLPEQWYKDGVFIRASINDGDVAICNLNRWVDVLSPYAQ